MLLSVFGNGYLIKCLTEKEIMNEKKLLLINHTKAFFIALLCVVALAMCHSCMTYKKAISNKDVVNTILQLHPCLNKDSLIVTSDTTILHDTLTNYAVISDTVGKYIHNTVKIKIKSTITIHDTIQHYQENTRKIDLLTSRISDYSKTIASLQQQVKDCPKATDKCLWWFIGAIVLLVVSWALFIYLKLKL
jgi:amino acid permease